jgi:hypothetical protein
MRALTVLCILAHDVAHVNPKPPAPGTLAMNKAMMMGKSGAHQCIGFHEVEQTQSVSMRHILLLSGVVFGHSRYR